MVPVVLALNVFISLQISSKKAYLAQFLSNGENKKIAT
jgi:hypothetical protein